MHEALLSAWRELAPKRSISVELEHLKSSNGQVIYGVLLHTLAYSIKIRFL